ncbi:MAG: phage tail-like protein [Ascidiaceihabitans sp.]|jgi:phage tail-like protein
MSLLGPPPPIGAFNFRVDFYEQSATGTPDSALTPICSGRFSEVSGIEATMEPKAIREGGRNFGEHQRAGMVKFSTVILKRGATTAPDLWTWFELVGKGKSAIRMQANVIQMAMDGQTPIMTWVLGNALPIKFRATTLIATTPDIAIEELHFVHEDLRLEIAGGAP